MPPACVLEHQQRLNHLQHLSTRVGQDQAFAMALKQCHPSCASRWRIWRVSGGCEINNRCAARLMLFSSATTAKARSRRISRECNLEVVILKRYHEKGITQVRHTSLPFLLTHHHREEKRCPANVISSVRKCFSGWMVRAGSRRRQPAGYRPDFARYLIEFPSAIFTPAGSIYAAGKSPPSPRSRRWVTPSHS